MTDQPAVQNMEHVDMDDIEKREQWQDACEYILGSDATDLEAVNEAAQIMRNEIERLREENDRLLAIEATITADDVTCPVCEGRPLAPTEGCMANCRGGKVLKTSAIVLQNVPGLIEALQESRREIQRLRSERIVMLEAVESWKAAGKPRTSAS